MIAFVLHNGRQFRVGEYDDGKVAFDACDRFAEKRGWKEYGKSFENSGEDMETTLKL